MYIHIYRQLYLMGPLLIFFYLLSSPTVSSAGTGGNSTGENPFTPKAALIRYWNTQITNNETKPLFLLSKASPLNAVDAATYANLAGNNTLADHIKGFCSAANLLCFPDLAPCKEKHDSDVNFAVYDSKNFTNYGTDRPGGLDSFKNYSENSATPVDSFREYSSKAAGHDDKFDSYGTEGNVADQGFSNYGGGATGGKGDFSNYNKDVNEPNLNFRNYGDVGNRNAHSFATYTDNANNGSETFTSYGKKGGAPNEFTNYGSNANVLGSGFTGYGEGADDANDTFTNYGLSGNTPEDNFTSYGDGGSGSVDNFANYRDQANTGDDNFASYGKNSTLENVTFTNYGKSFNEGTDKFAGYGQGTQGQVGFTGYGLNNTFKDYADKKQVTFASYTANATNTTKAITTQAVKNSGKKVNRWVEPGRFFRESMLKERTVMPMPDIKDKMPKRSFLPRTISSKLPFATARLAEMKRIFHAADNSSMESMMVSALSECERKPSPGETKRCVSSIEDMIDFATSVLGKNIVVRSTENVNGSKQEILIGQVKGINGGNVTKSVSCHQSLFPYLLYYCHSVPEVRVYSADLLDPKSKAKINNGVAICHLNTSAWSATHGAFLALGAGPGKIEVCHWIFENDMTWTTAD